MIVDINIQNESPYQRAARRSWRAHLTPPNAEQSMFNPDNTNNLLVHLSTVEQLV